MVLRVSPSSVNISSRSTEGVYPFLYSLSQFLHFADVRATLPFQLLPLRLCPKTAFKMSRLIRFQHTLPSVGVWHRGLAGCLSTQPPGPLITTQSCIAQDSRSMPDLQLESWWKIVRLTILWESITTTTLCICCPTSGVTAAVAVLISILTEQVVMSYASSLSSFVFLLKNALSLQ